MVDASLRSRPAFGTFLRSDTNAGGDGLTYYEYQRLLRSQKVAVLQNKRAKTYFPGYKKVVAPTSQKIFQLKLTQKAGAPSTSCRNIKQVAFPTEHAFTDSALQEETSVLSQKQAALSYGSTLANKEGMHVETERLPSISKPRLVKSATARTQHCSWSGANLPSAELQRPKTACSSKEAEVQVSELQVQGFERTEQNAVNKPPHVYSKTDGILLEGNPLVAGTVHHHRAHTTECFHVEDLEALEISVADQDALASTFIWSTTTQRANEAVGWAEKVPPPNAVHHSTIERFPDPVSHRLTFRRYHSEPAGWQAYGTEWDYIQTRTGGFIRGPQAMNYCSKNTKNQQIPGYLGCIPNGEISDDRFADFNPTLLIRSLKPKPTSISRHSNIPGYTGHVHWTRIDPAHSDMGRPEPTTTARVHRHIPLEDDQSPFRRNGLFSKMITTVSPHNPYNKIDL